MKSKPVRDKDLLQLDFDVDTSGRVSNDLTPRDDPTGSAETVSVFARSQHGNIAVRRV